MAVGVANPACFSAPLDILQIREIPIHYDYEYVELMSIVDYAKTKAMDADWLNELEIRLKEYTEPGALRKDAPLRDMVKRGEWRQIAKKLKRRLF